MTVIPLTILRDLPLMKMMNDFFSFCCLFCSFNMFVNMLMPVGLS